MFCWDSTRSSYWTLCNGDDGRSINTVWLLFHMNIACILYGGLWAMCTLCNLNAFQHTVRVSCSDTYLPMDAIQNQQKLAKYFLLATGYKEIDFKLGTTHVFLRPGKNTLIHQYNMLDEAAIKDLASRIKDQITNEIQQQDAQKRENV